MSEILVVIEGGVFQSAYGLKEDDLLFIVDLDDQSDEPTIGAVYTPDDFEHGCDLSEIDEKFGTHFSEEA